MAGTHYIGKAGQFAAMAELANRGYNVSIPEIDVGDDVFVLDDDTGQLTRIQVKTATGSKLKRTEAYRCQFSVRLDHVNNAQVAGTHYIFVGRCGRRWRFLVIERGVLRHLISDGLGSVGPTGENQMITVLFYTDGHAKSSTRKDAKDLSQYVNRWDAWPVPA